VWEAAIVLAIVGLGISRIADVVNELLSPGVPARLGPSMLSGQRVVLWIVAAIFAIVAVVTVEYDPIAATGMAADADDIWNILFIVTIADAADVFFKRRLLRP
jgi:hypothetical protein